MLSLKRRVANALGGVLGAHIIPKHRLGGWLEDHFVGDLLRALDVDCVFDVGANKGQFATQLRRGGFGGTILSFEPGPAAYSALSEAASTDPHWHTFNMALGASETSLELNVMESDVFSSFHTPMASEEAHWKDMNAVAATVQVDVKPLHSVFESLANQYGFRRPFLKMDTQGFDLEVVKGAGGQIKKFVGLSSEIAIRRIYEESPTMLESIDTISQAGFEFVNFMPVHFDRILNPVELNSFAVRRDIAQ